MDPAARSPIVTSAGPNVEANPPLLSVDKIPVKRSAPLEPMANQELSLAETPPMTESSTLIHPSVEAGSGKATRTAELGEDVVDVVVAGAMVEVDSGGGAGVDVDDEHAAATKAKAARIASAAVRISVLTAFTRTAQSLIGFAFRLTLRNRLTTVTLRASACKT